ncbi:MAG: T9SS type A sorting domain-containing protein [Candidatus Cloacimonadaceae bacterium]|nr:T9SS type A sorting domain-containing protein [Candidatus Cloacimonadaceae bacterium]
MHRRRTPIVLLSLLLFTTMTWGTISVENTNRLVLNSISFDMNLIGDKRVAEHIYTPLSFTVVSTTYPDSVCITWTAPEMDIVLSFKARPGLGAEAYLATARALFKQEIYLHELYLAMDGYIMPVTTLFKGAEAIYNSNSAMDINIMPFTDKAVEYAWGANRFWIVASNYDECEGVEALTGNRIVLYDYKGHFFRVFNPQSAQVNLLRDCMYQSAGNTFAWSFLFFSEKPYLPVINRWPYGKKAALSITNDADGETMSRLQAVFEGSNNPANPKYYTQGFFARSIPVSNTVFGSNIATMGSMWTKIRDRGNSIGYHSYTDLADPREVNQQSLLVDMLPFNIRMWIDHGLPSNPENMGYNGLDPESVNFIGDIIDQSGIDYIWAGDTPPTNPFNAFEEAWRLPHLVYEAKAFTRPIWFYGRTRMEAWAYNNGWSMLGFKYLMTPANLDKLIASKGLHLSYTHFCFNNSPAVTSFFQIAQNGDFEVRDDVDEMLQMLDYYRTYKGLWIGTAENIFDRMLAIEKVRVISVVSTSNPKVLLITLENVSDSDITDFSFRFGNQTYHTPMFNAGELRNYHVSTDSSGNNVPPYSDYRISYQNGQIIVKDADGAMLQPMQMDIYNLRGQKVIQHCIQQQTLQSLIPFANKGSGVYFIRMTHSDGSVLTRRFVVVK